MEEEISSRQGPIYITLDALDEGPNDSGIPTARKRVLDLLKDLVGFQLSNLHFCITSRPEVDVQVALEPLAFHSVTIHDQDGQKKDIISDLSSTGTQIWR